MSMSADVSTKLASEESMAPRALAWRVVMGGRLSNSASIVAG
jgi:hypothetical protein